MARRGVTRTKLVVPGAPDAATPSAESSRRSLLSAVDSTIGHLLRSAEDLTPKPSAESSRGSVLSAVDSTVDRLLKSAEDVTTEPSAGDLLAERAPGEPSHARAPLPAAVLGGGGGEASSLPGRACDESSAGALPAGQSGGMAAGPETSVASLGVAIPGEPSAFSLGSSDALAVDAALGAVLDGLGSGAESPLGSPALSTSTLRDGGDACGAEVVGFPSEVSLRGDAAQAQGGESGLVDSRVADGDKVEEGREGEREGEGEGRSGDAVVLSYVGEEGRGGDGGGGEGMGGGKQAEEGRGSRREQRRGAEEGRTTPRGTALLPDREEAERNRMAFEERLMQR